MTHPPFRGSVPNDVFPFPDKRLNMVIKMSRGWEMLPQRGKMQSVLSVLSGLKVRQHCLPKAKSRETGDGGHGVPQTSLSTCFSSQPGFPNLPALRLHHLWSILLI